MFEIPPAPHGIPMSWRGHWYGRDGESIGALNQTKFDAIRAKGAPDWSAEIVSDATMADLDPAAILAARSGYKKKNANSKLAAECNDWTDAAFLNKAKLARSGKITRATLLLLGNGEAAHWLSPADTRMTWILRGSNDADVDYQHFGPPFVLNTEALYGKIRNVTYRIMPDGSLFPIELLKYDAWVMREVLHNCIAHQDYMMGGRISVIERDDTLTMTNLGDFIPQSVDKVLESTFTPDRYRNPFLADAMVQIDMIDTIGSGITRAHFSVNRVSTSSMSWRWTRSKRGTIPQRRNLKHSRKKA
jgi:ATP-dependent DNA helicase RecG